MQKKVGILLICLLGRYQVMWADFESEYPGYENKITEIHELDTGSGHKYVVRFANTGPICTYAPESFAESMDDTVYRAFMPNTDIADSIETSLDIDNDETGTEIVFHGESIQKVVGNEHIIFIVKN